MGAPKSDWHLYSPYNFKCLESITGFNTLRKKILSTNDKNQKRDYINQLCVAKGLSQIPGLNVECLEYGDPPSDILFEYKTTKYIAEVKTIHWPNKSELLNKFPFTINFGPTSELIKKMPEELPEILTSYDQKIIMEIIFTEGYRQLKGNYFNIIFLIVDDEPWWIDEDDVEDAVKAILIRAEDKEFSKRARLNAVCFCRTASPPNYLYQNPSAREINHELQSFIKKINVKM